MSLLFTGVSFILFQKLFKINISKKTLCTYIVSNLVIFIVCIFFMNDTYSYIFMPICSSIVFIFLEKIPLLKIFSFFTLNSIILLNILLFTFSLTFPIAQIISILLYLSVGFIIYFFFQHEPCDFLFITSINEKSHIIIILSIINSLLTFLAYLFLENLHNNISYLFILDIYFLASIIIALQTCKIEYAKRKIDNLKLCNKTILNIHDDLRAFKHSFHNIIQGLGGYIDTGDLNGLKKYYKDILTECNILNNHYTLNSNLINNPAIYNILATKYYIAHEHNIEINLEIFLDLNNLNIKIYEFTRILGILLDNAIEASKDCKKRTINILFKKDKYKQMLIIENTYDNKEISIDQIYEKNFSTKPNNTGLGLWEVRRILNRYSHLNLHTTKNNDYFSQQLEIYTN